MADIDVKREADAPAESGVFSVLELVYWIGGILLIPLAPILMMMFLTPHSGM